MEKNTKFFFTDIKEAGHKSRINLMKILIKYYAFFLPLTIISCKKKYFRLKIWMFSCMFKQSSCQKEINLV